MTRCKVCVASLERGPVFYDSFCSVRCVNGPPKPRAFSRRSDRTESYDGPATGVGPAPGLNEGRAGAPWINGGWHR